MSKTTSANLTIERIGSEGDGLARSADGRLITVPFALPGETIIEGVVETTSAERQVPPCKHFMHCGGCVAQHMGPTLYADWKRGLVVDALRQHRIDADVAPLVTVAPHSRRRASFSIQRTTQGQRVGFHVRRDKAILPLEQCPVLSPRLEAALPLLGRIAGHLTGLTVDTRMAVADLDGGLDVTITGASSKLDAEQRARLAAEATAGAVSRLTIERETILERAAVRLTGPAGALLPPPGAFFQAVAAAEQAIVSHVLEGLPKKPKRTLDLFAGIGTLTLPLAQRAPVHALDGDKTALAALERAARQATGLKPVTSHYRDLIGEPLSPKELEPYDTVVLDPPRAGAKSQCERLAVSKVETVVMVSCNPQTFARDIRSLVDGGYRLERVTPIDQFVWSAHVETVAVLRKSLTRKRK